MEGAIAALISIACLGAYGQAYRTFRSPFFIVLSLALCFLSCGTIASVFHASAYLEAAADTCMMLAGALMAIAALQLKYAFKLACEGS